MNKKQSIYYLEILNNDYLTLTNCWLHGLFFVWIIAVKLLLITKKKKLFPKQQCPLSSHPLLKKKKNVQAICALISANKAWLAALQLNGCQIWPRPSRVFVRSCLCFRGALLLTRRLRVRPCASVGRRFLLGWNPDRGTPISKQAVAVCPFGGSVAEMR